MKSQYQKVSPTILVIDNDPSTSAVFKRLLETKDYNVLTTNSSRESLDIVQRVMLDLIILDLLMPEMDGWQVLNRIKENKNFINIPLIFLTAKSDDFTKTFGTTQTADFIEKPFDINNLHVRINNVIRKANNDYLSIE